MERKYYLRGLGLGIAVTAVIMGIALSGNGAMTNEEIIARAKELGLVENTVLSNTGNEDAAQENAVGQDITDSADQPQNVEGTGQDDLAAADGINENPEVIDADSEAEDVPEEEDVDESDETEQEADIDAESSGQNDEGGTDSESESGDTAMEEAQDDTADLEEDASETENANEIITSGTVRVITINSGDSSYTVAKKLADVGVVTSAATFDAFLCQNGYDKRLRTGTFSIPADASDEQIARIVAGLE